MITGRIKKHDPNFNAYIYNYFCHFIIGSQGAY